MKMSSFKWFYLSVFFFTCLLMAGLLSAATYDVTGTWVIVMESYTDDCDVSYEEKTVEGWFDQSTDSYTIRVDDYLFMRGTVNGAVYTDNWEYVGGGDDYPWDHALDGYTIVDNIEFTLTSSTSGSGTNSWERTDSSGSNSCQGVINFTLTKGGSSNNDDDSDAGDDSDDDDDDDDDDDGSTCFIGTVLFGGK